MPSLGKKRPPHPLNSIGSTGNLRNNLLRLLPCTVCLALLGLLPPLPSTGVVFCGWAFVPELVGKNMNGTGPVMAGEPRRAEEDSLTRILVHSVAPRSAAEKLRAARDPSASTSGSPSLPSSYNGRSSLLAFSSSEPIAPEYKLDLSTKENYGAEDADFFGPYRHVRAKLDYEYHGNYLRSRQQFQDRIVEKFFNESRHCKTPTEPWIVFTAGVMGAGKSHTLRQLASRGLFPLESYVIADPDEIRSHFPEYHMYAMQNPERAGELTHKEAGYLTEIVTEVALQRGHNILVDGSLRDHEWYQEYFAWLRDTHQNLRIAILHIVADKASIFARAERRGRETGRVVPLETLEYSFRHVPISVNKLAPSADFFCELDNSAGAEEVGLKTSGITWESFRNTWAQTMTCAPSPASQGKL